MASSELYLWYVSVCLAFLSPAAADDLSQGILGQIDRSLQRAGKYLLAEQTPDGAWRSRVYGALGVDPALTPHVMSAVFYLPQAGPEAKAADKAGSRPEAKPAEEPQRRPEPKPAPQEPAEAKSGNGSEKKEPAGKPEGRLLPWEPVQLPAEVPKEKPAEPPRDADADRRTETPGDGG